MPRILFAALAVVAAPLCALAEDRVSQFTLDNGLEAVVVEDHRTPAVMHMLYYKVGSADEPAGMSGVAHLLEHLMFKGTETHPPGAFSDFVSANGGSDNAFTSWDMTAYFQRVAADLLPDVMAFEADRMVNLVLDPAQIATERDVVLEERAQRVDSDPSALFREQMRAALYLNHSYGRPIIGWRDEIAALDRDALERFYRTHYRPENAVLVVVGDVTPEEVRRHAVATYGKVAVPQALAVAPRPSEPPHKAARRIVFEDPRIAQPFLSRSYLAPERDPGAQETAAALQLLASLLGGDPASSHLGEALQFDTQTAVYTGVWYNGQTRDRTSLSITVVPAQDVTLEQAETALDRALERFLEDGVDPERLDRLKRQYLADETYARDDAGRQARRYGGALVVGLDLEDVQAWPEAIQAVTGKEILAAAREVLVPERSVTGWALRPDAPAEVTQ